jgi:hypothetical protein
LDARLDYEGVKRLAAATGRNVKHLLALDLTADPFYADIPFGCKKAEWFLEIWDRYKAQPGIHLRGLHYKIVASPDPPKLLNGETYWNHIACFSELQKCSAFARHLGLVPPDAFRDQRNKDPHLFACNGGLPSKPGLFVGDPYWPLPVIKADLASQISLEMPTPEATGYEYDQTDQPFHQEIWIEKSTANDILIPLCQQLRINLVTSIGFQSITATVNLLRRLKAIRDATGSYKPARIHYISDFDPAGLGMPVAVAREVEFYIDRYAPGAEVLLTPIMMTKQQVIDYELPRAMIKDSDVRKENFEDRHGKGAVELDAFEVLQPGEFRRIVRRAVSAYRDERLEERLEERAETAQKRIEEAWHDATEDERKELIEIEAELRRIYEPYQERLRLANEWLQADLAPIKARLESLKQSAAAKRDSLGVVLPDRPAAVVNGSDESAWLFDSNRDYEEQLSAYKDHKGEETAKKVIHRSCLACGAAITATTRKKRYCNAACRKSGERDRRRAKKGEDEGVAINSNES